MGILRIFLIIVEVATCLLLVGVILLQKSRDSGLGMAFGAGMGESLFGAQAGNVLTRITVILAAVFLVNTTLLALVQPPADVSLVDRIAPATPAQPITPESRVPVEPELPPGVAPFEIPETPFEPVVPHDTAAPEDVDMPPVEGEDLSR